MKLRVQNDWSDPKVHSVNLMMTLPEARELFEDLGAMDDADLMPIEEQILSLLRIRLPKLATPPRKRFPPNRPFWNLGEIFEHGGPVD